MFTLTRPAANSLDSIPTHTIHTCPSSHLVYIHSHALRVVVLQLVRRRRESVISQSGRADRAVSRAGWVRWRESDDSTVSTMRLTF